VEMISSWAKAKISEKSMYSSVPP
jgi:hypothetical protein